MGPDGRIYIVHSGTSYTQVDYPNIRGKGCGFRLDALDFNGAYTGSAIPYLPNYRLGPLDGSSCDTLGLNNVPLANFRVEDTLGTLSRFFYDLSAYEPTAWSWTFGDGGQSSSRYPIHQYASPGWYPVCLTASNANGSYTYCRNILVGSISATEPTGLRLSISPNPADGHTTVQLPEDAVFVHTWVRDALGRTVWEEALAAGQKTLELETGSWPSGSYLISVLREDGQMRSGWVVVRKQ